MFLVSCSTHLLTIPRRVLDGSSASQNRSLARPGQFLQPENIFISNASKHKLLRIKANFQKLLLLVWEILRVRLCRAPLYATESCQTKTNVSSRRETSSPLDLHWAFQLMTYSLGNIFPLPHKRVSFRLGALWPLSMVVKSPSGPYITKPQLK